MPARFDSDLVSVSLVPKKPADLPDARYLAFYRECARHGIPAAFGALFAAGFLGCYDADALAQPHSHNGAPPLFPQFSAQCAHSGAASIEPHHANNLRFYCRHLEAEDITLIANSPAREAQLHASRCLPGRLIRGDAVDAAREIKDYAPTLLVMKGQSDEMEGKPAESQIELALSLEDAVGFELSELRQQILMQAPQTRELFDRISLVRKQGLHLAA
jgi:hypothetical protein